MVERRRLLLSWVGWTRLPGGLNPQVSRVVGNAGWIGSPAVFGLKAAFGSRRWVEVN